MFLKNVFKITNIGLLLMLFFMSCKQETSTTQTEENKKQPTVNVEEIQQGALASAENNTGNVWVKPHVMQDSIYDMMLVTEAFEPGARTYWHIHPAGEILVVTKGEGYHQIKGQELEEIKKGDVIKCPPGVSHWHGAVKNNVMSHLVILPNIAEGSAIWQDEVAFEEEK